MGIRDYIKSFRAPKENKYLNIDGTPKTVVTTNRFIQRGILNTDRNEKLLRDYWNYYKNDDMVFAAVNIIAYNTVMCGYTLMSDNKKAKALIQKTFDRMDIDSYVLDNVRFGLVIGDAYLEKVKSKGSKKKTVSLNTVSPITMVINTDRYGRLMDYQQKIDGRLLETKLSKDDIIHLKFFEDLDSPYGISIIQPARTSIDRMRDVDESLYYAVMRHGSLKYDITVGTEEEIPPKAVFDKIKVDLEDITSQSELIHPGVIKIDTIDESGVPGIESYADVFLKKTLVGLMCSQEALGMSMGSGTDAMANQRSLMFERFIKNIQHKLSTQLRVDLINQILVENGFEPDIVYMKYNSVTNADEESESKWMGNLFRGFPEGKKPLSRNEIRARLGYKPVEGGDDDFMETTRSPALQPAD